MAKEQIEINLTDEEVELLKKMAEENNMSIDEFVEHTLRRYQELIDNPDDSLEDV